MGYTKAGGYAIPGPGYIYEDEDDCDETVNLLHDKVQFSLQVYLLRQLAKTVKIRNKRANVTHLLRLLHFYTP